MVNSKITKKKVMLGGKKTKKRLTLMVPRLSLSKKRIRNSLVKSKRHRKRGKKQKAGALFTVLDNELYDLTEIDNKEIITKLCKNYGCIHPSNVKYSSLVIKKRLEYQTKINESNTDKFISLEGDIFEINIV